jgi:hypothetical protein
MSAIIKCKQVSSAWKGDVADKIPFEIVHACKGIDSPEANNPEMPSSK